MSDNSSIRLDSVFLTETTFSRTVIVDYENPAFKSHVDFDIAHQHEDDYLQVTFSLTFVASVNNDTQINASVKMAATFQLPSNPDLPITRFAEINAPAIIFPFVREHLASLSLKSGLSPILLQPINFVKFAQASDREAKQT
jgi:preprotein translocase subunit SecB